MRILLVDDSSDFLRAAHRFLAGQPRLTVVGQARSGEEALALAARLGPDLVLMDIAMPGMSGIEATRLIKQRSGAPRVIVMTVHDAPAYRAEAARAGADGFVGKGDFGAAIIPAIRSIFPPASGEGPRGTGRGVESC